ncbi:Hpt domain-containing protein [Vibrio aestuarianus]|uniref:Hpt domain-containing protein n=1 Tax=Vibrio aestuarianus TaxID=28171 RepID=A0A9X4IS43_9VIBR|nr:Hpt domain-containing protein [Vibrio aestuarianus]MDE1240929.1 Hpt domain-containing protein [Vibrio aestuarianus]
MFGHRKWNGIKVRYYLLILLGWVISIGMVYWQNHSSYQTMSAVEELGNSVDELRSSLYFKEPYRSARANDLALNIQLLYSLRLQLEVEHRVHLFQPDIQQLLHVTDRYIQLTRSYLSIELKIQELVEQLKLLRDKPTTPPEVQQKYTTLGAYVFEAMFSDMEQNPQIYRTLDRLYVEAQQLPPAQKQELEQSLAQASELLNQYAQGAYLVQNLLRHSIYQQITHVEDQYHYLLKSYGYVITAISAIAMLLMGWLLSIPKRVTVEVEPVEADKEEAVLKEPEARRIEANDAIDMASPVPKYVDSKINIEQMLDALNGDNDSVKMLLGVFIQDHSQDAEQLEMLIHSDRKRAQRRVHSLKSVAANLGAEGLKQISYEIEQVLDKGSMPSEKQLHLLAKYLSSTIESAQLHLDE